MQPCENAENSLADFVIDRTVLQTQLLELCAGGQ